MRSSMKDRIPMEIATIKKTMNKREKKTFSSPNIVPTMTTRETHVMLDHAQTDEHRMRNIVRQDMAGKINCPHKMILSPHRLW